MPDGRKIHMDRLATHLRIFLREKDGSFEEIKVNVRHNDNIYYETSKDSRYVLIQTSATKELVAGCVFDLKKKEIVNNGFDVLQDNPSIRPILGPFGSVVNAMTKKSLLLNYRGGVLTIKMPMVGVIEGIDSDEERRIYVKTDVAVWMVSIESDTVSYSSIKLFDALDSRINPTFKIVNLTPSIICTKIGHVFYVYDLLKMELIHKRAPQTALGINLAVPRDNFAVSPDGKLLFQHNAEQFHKPGINHMIFISPFQTPVESLMIDNVPGELVCSDKGSRGHSHDYRPEKPLVMLGFTWPTGNPMTNDVLSVSNDGTTLYAKNDYSTFGIVFKHPLPHPVFERKKEDLTWIRVMSDGALETHRTWPESIPLFENEKMAREVRETGFESESLALVAHSNFPQSGRAIGMYIERLIHIIARALRE